MCNQLSCILSKIEYQVGFLIPMFTLCGRETPKTPSPVGCLEIPKPSFQFLPPKTSRNPVKPQIPKPRPSNSFLPTLLPRRRFLKLAGALLLAARRRPVSLCLVVLLLWVVFCLVFGWCRQSRGAVAVAPFLPVLNHQSSPLLSLFFLLCCYSYPSVLVMLLLHWCY